ncbi:carbon-nitrogen hydrolase family protein [Sphingoaurantiacus capsulatus]|uniref:Carbon-nitrogen hydrolase family protein n=1 Tax=Sphingoaurantiacus capsulatus TaxID=1771310 RepID=A0ABV7X7V7_9SPHN
MLKVGVLQMTSGIDPAANARAVADGIAALAAEGAQIVFTPEMSGLLDRDRSRVVANSTVEADDPTLAAAREAATAAKVWVHLGSCAIRPTADADRLLNRGFLIDDRGVVRARYDKMHLFDVDLPTGERYRESATYIPGEAAVAADTPWGRLGLSICYDLRFARLFEALSGAGAAIIAVPAAFTRPTGEAHWHTLLRARAIEAGAFVVAAAQTGEHEDGRATYGHSLVIDPWGRVLLDMGEAAGHAICEIDLAAVADTRARIPTIAHRRDVTLRVEA